MTQKLILVLDEGTTSTRAMLFDRAGTVQGVAQRDLTQHYPAAGWVEHDANEIWTRTLACALDMAGQAGGARNIASIGITNQRETVVAWDRLSGEPLAPAIVWQDRRTGEACAALKAAGHEAAVQAKTGLLLDPYFSATKMRWLIDNVPAVADAAREGRLALGTVESWLVFKLTGGQAHITDATNASRTLLLALDGADWDEELLALFGVPRACLPALCDNAGALATTAPHLLGAPVPICGMAGDQQAATIGQACLSPGETKATYGTGAFVLANMGHTVPRSAHRLLGTVLWQLGGQRTYALEGSVFVAGSLIKWLRDSLGVISSAAETEALARSVPDNGGVALVPAHSGLGAPHWQPDARGLITGLTLGSTKAHLVRAGLEAMAHQTADLAAAFAADGAQWSCLKVDGGMVANDWMVQDIADILDLPVIRPALAETTALGAAMLAAVGAGIHASLPDAAAAMRGEAERFMPQMDGGTRAARNAHWRAALSRI
ncbi:glycerol kinase GlpK [Alteraurantiacibacter palmitatis]|uniref:ATP:glycerol 3-phosphotransferase n=1 Tax=Alteraurantiacibacter palmitatis TaxID=2054628 RepID=A0ABV7E7H6_9SPHN